MNKDAMQRGERFYAVERFLKVADAASKALGKGDFCTYMDVPLSNFLDIAYSEKFPIAQIDEGTACIAANEWDQSHFVMSMEGGGWGHFA